MGAMTGARQLEPAPVIVEISPTALETPDIPLNFGPGFRGRARAGTSFLAVLTLVLIALQFTFIMHSPHLDDPDVWWHMRNAQYLFQHHQFPRQDLYSFTVAGHPCTNHEWLSAIPCDLGSR